MAKKKESTKERISKADDRALMLVKKYPVVFVLVIFIGFTVGLSIGAALWAF